VFSPSANPGIHRPPQPPQLSFWDPATWSYSAISRIYSRGPQYSQEDIVWSAWQAICLLYFHIAAPATNPNLGVRWAVEREAYRGRGNKPSHIRPDILTVKVIPRQTPVSVPVIQERDYLWIECKASSRNTPGEWMLALTEAVDRISITHAGREIFFAIAIGVRVVFFMWTPNEPVVPPIRVQLTDGTLQDVDNHVRVIPVGQELNPNTSVLRFQEAAQLDCLTPSPIDPASPRHLATLQRIEMILTGIRDAPLQGLNPPQF
jgi:hypothetical protein